MVEQNKLQGFYFKKITFSLFLLTLTFFLFACSGTASNFTRNTNAKKLYVQQQQDQEAIKQQQQVEQIMEAAFSQVGTPYRYGGNSPKSGFDCSGFVKWVYAQFGVDLPRTSRSMQGAGVEVAYDDMKPGDLIFFNYRTFHVGIYTGDGKYIHSPRTGKVIQEDNLSDSGRGNKIAGIRRIIENDKIDSISDSLKDDWVKEARSQVSIKKATQTATKAKTKAIVKARTGNNTKVLAKKVNKKAENIKLAQHNVSKGDTIYDLAKRYKVSQSEFLKANKLNKTSKLKLGQKLVVPKKN